MNCDVRVAVHVVGILNSLLRPLRRRSGSLKYHHKVLSLSYLVVLFHATYPRGPPHRFVALFLAPPTLSRSLRSSLFARRLFLLVQETTAFAPLLGRPKVLGSQATLR